MRAESCNLAARVGSVPTTVVQNPGHSHEAALIWWRSPGVALISPYAVVMEAVVSLRGVVKRFGSGTGLRVVLDGVDLDVWPGEMVAIVGRSGSGKSTLLHMIGGLDRADAGSIRVAGLRVDGVGESELTDFRRSGVGFVFQFFHLLPELTGEENVLLPARLAGDGRSARGRALELIDRLGVSGVAGAFPATMSGGEQQRVAIARALVAAPRVVLADEPTGNLDEDSGRDVVGLLRDIADEGRAVVLVTHDREAAELADHVLVLRDGRLEPTG